MKQEIAGRVVETENGPEAPETPEMPETEVR